MFWNVRIYSMQPICILGIWTATNQFLEPGKSFSLSAIIPMKKKQYKSISYTYLQNQGKTTTKTALDASK